MGSHRHSNRYERIHSGETEYQEPNRARMKLPDLPHSAENSGEGLAVGMEREQTQKEQRGGRRDCEMGWVGGNGMDEALQNTDMGWGIDGIREK